MGTLNKNKRKTKQGSVGLKGPEGVPAYPSISDDSEAETSSTTGRPRSKALRQRGQKTSEDVARLLKEQQGHHRGSATRR